MTELSKVLFNSWREALIMVSFDMWVWKIIAAALCWRGKSELQRAECWITSSGGNSQASATEIYRRVTGKGEKVR